MRCNLIDRKISYLNTNIFKKLKKKNLALGKNVNNKRKSTSGIYTFPVLHTHNKMFVFLTNDKPVIKIVLYGITFIFLICSYIFVIVK